MIAVIETGGKQYRVGEGDIINVDVTTILDGYYADASRMFVIGKAEPEVQKLVDVAWDCLKVGEQVCQEPYVFVGDLGNAIAKLAHKNGFTVVRDYCGHGVGLASWEDPFICHAGRRGEGMVLVPGMVITVEPMINMGTEDYYESGFKNWEVHTADGSLSAQWENTILITENGPEILSE